MKKEKPPRKVPPPGGWQPKPLKRAEPIADEKRCVADSKQRKGRCHQPRKPGYNKCHYHNGEQGGNRLVHGRHSEHLGPLAHKYRASIHDKTLLDLREPIAILDAIVKRLGERAAARDTPELRERAWALYQAMREHTTKGDSQAAANAMNELGRLLRDGAEDTSALNDLRDTVDMMGKRIEGAWHVKLQKSNAMNGREVSVLVARLLDIASQITNAETALKIGRAFEVEMQAVRGDSGDAEALLGRRN